MSITLLCSVVLCVLMPFVVFIFLCYALLFVVVVFFFFVVVVEFGLCYLYICRSSARNQVSSDIELRLQN